MVRNKELLPEPLGLAHLLRVFATLEQLARALDGQADLARELEQHVVRAGVSALKYKSFTLSNSHIVCLNRQNGIDIRKIEMPQEPWLAGLCRFTCRGMDHNRSHPGRTF